MNDVVSKISKLMDERKWTAYRLEQESNVPAPTIRRWLQTDMYPSIPVLMQVCNAFGLTIGEFFTQSVFVELTDERKILFDKWSRLTKVQKSAIMSHMDGYLA